MQPSSGGGGGDVTSVSNIDGSLTIFPTTGAVIASINLTHQNMWLSPQGFLGGTFLTLSDIATWGGNYGTIAFNGSTDQTMLGILGNTDTNYMNFNVNSGGGFKFYTTAISLAKIFDPGSGSARLSLYNGDGTEQYIDSSDGIFQSSVGFQMQASSGNSALVLVNNGADTTTSIFHVNTALGATLFDIFPNGNIKIPTLTASKPVFTDASKNLTSTGTIPVANGGTGTTTVFTTGSVVFAGASGVYTQDNANLFWDDTNNRLGIGKTNPSYAIDLTGTGVLSLARFGNSAGASTAYVTLGAFQDGGTTYAGMYFGQPAPDNTNYGFLGSPTDTYLNALTSINFRIGNGAERLVIRGTNTVTPSGMTLGAYTATADAMLQAFSTPSIGAYSVANWNSTGQIVPLAAFTPTSVGSLAATFPALVLGREGVGGVAYPAFAEFKIGRYANVSTDSKTQLDIALVDGSAQTAGVNIMSLQSGGNVGVGTTSPTSLLHTAGSFSTGYVAKTGTYTATVSNYTIDCTANTFTVTLPTAVGITGRIYVIKNSGAGTITVGTTSSQTIDGVTTQTLATQYSSYTVQSNGANWIII